MSDAQLTEVLKRLGEVSDQIVLVLGGLETLQSHVLADHERINRLEAALEAIRSEPPPFRAPQPSLTSEERRTGTESIRAAVDDQTQKTVPYLEKMARSSKWTPIAIFLGSMAAGFMYELAHLLFGGH